MGCDRGYAHSMTFLLRVRLAAVCDCVVRIPRIASLAPIGPFEAETPRGPRSTRGPDLRYFRYLQVPSYSAVRTAFIQYLSDSANDASRLYRYLPPRLQWLTWVFSIQYFFSSRFSTIRLRGIHFCPFSFRFGFPRDLQ